jgi:phospholipid/cholesterol/gamma-HCH transport system permease protein
MSPTSWVEGLGHFAYFAIRSLGALPLAFARLGEVLRQLYRILIGALPLATVAGIAIGLVLWMHMRGVLLRTAGQEALQYLPTALSLAVLLEFAPIGAGLIVAGRTGASLGAEIGAMRLTEQLDAVEMLGRSTVRELLAPRILACMAALPLLTILIAALALLGAFGAEMTAGTMSAMRYDQQTWAEVRIADVVPAVLKTVVFGFSIGVAGCYFGMQASGGTEGVGRSATRGVETATLLVLGGNVILVRLIQWLVP